MMKIVSLRLLLGLAVVLGATFAAANAPAVAQESEKPKLAPAKWLKRCLKSESSDAVFCEISYGRLVPVNDEGQERWLATAGIQEVKGRAEKDLFIFAPLGVRLLPGLAFRIDEHEPKRAPYTICMARGCQVVVKIDDAVIDTMKSGTDLLLQFQDAAGKTVAGKVTLSGFTAAYDGEPAEMRTVSAPASGAKSSPGGAAQKSDGKGDAPVN